MASTRSTIAWVIAALLISGAALGQEKTPPKAAGEQAVSKSPVQKPQRVIGFVDKNHDGINDRFADADGDGTNDVDGKPYPHSFRFADKDKDGINDLWIDRDGDGVNDLGTKLKGAERRMAQSNVLDVDGDGRNDITGERYDGKKGRWMGERWGFWDELKHKLRGRFVDENGDGIDDRLQTRGRRGMMERHGSHRNDVFVDEDGDGICDGRNDVLRRMGRMHGGGKRGGMHRP